MINEFSNIYETIIHVSSIFVKFEVLTVVKMWTVGFWVVTLCSLVGSYHHFRGTYHLHLQGRTDENGGDTFLQNIRTTYKTKYGVTTQTTHNPQVYSISVLNII
jgi:hypothetical protein